MQVAAPGLVFSTHQLEGRFPDWRRAFPEPSPHRAHFGRSDRLLGILRQARAMADRDRPAARLGLRPGGLTLAVPTSGGGTCDFQTVCDYRSGPVEAEFLPQDLIEVLAVVKDEAVDLVVGGPGVPAVLHATGLSVAIMPVTDEETNGEATENDESASDQADTDDLGPLDEAESDTPAERDEEGPGADDLGPGQRPGPAPQPHAAAEPAETHPRDDSHRGAPTMARDNAKMPDHAEEAPPPKTQPVHVVRLRNIRAAIWANETEYGPRYNTTVSRLYKDAADDQWKTSDSFGRDDLLLLAKVLDLAHTWICEESQASDQPF